MKNNLFTQLRLTEYESNQEKLEQLAMICKTNPKRILKGYYGTKYYHQFDKLLEVYYEEFPGCEKLPLKDRFSFNITTPPGTQTVFKVKEIIKKDDNPLHVHGIFEQKDFEIPIHISTGDSIPSFKKGAMLKLQVAATCTELSVYKIGEYLTDTPYFKRIDDELIHYEGPAICRSVIEVNELVQANLYRVFINTPMGFIFTIMIWEDQLSEEERELLKTNNPFHLNASLLFTGDVLYDTRQHGAIFDEINYTHLFGYCAELRDFSRLEPLLSEDCKYIGNQKAESKTQKRFP